MAACNAGFRTRFWRTAVLVNALTEAKKEGYLSRFMKQFGVRTMERYLCRHQNHRRALGPDHPSFTSVGF